MRMSHRVNDIDKAGSLISLPVSSDVNRVTTDGLPQVQLIIEGVNEVI
jgi:hypothetical protein